MHVRLLIPGFCAMAICASAQAQDLYRLEAGDQVEVWTSVDANLRRTVTIGPDGWLSLPLAGHLQGAGLTLPELETDIEGKLRRFFKEEPDLSLMLVPGTERVQTIYVSGDVATPGAYPFRSGLLVVHSLSMAGGTRRATAAASDEERSIMTRGEIGRAKARISALTTQAARIQAEKNGRPMVQAPAAAPADIEREQAILDERLAEKADRANAYAERLELRREFTKSLTEQAKAIESQIELSEERLQAISKLVSKGFAHGAQLIEIKRDIADVRARRHEIGGQIITAQMDMATEIEEFREALAERTAQLMVDLRDTLRDLDATQSSLIDNERVLRLLDTEAPLNPEEEAMPLTISIIRSVNGKPTMIDASEMSELQPDDLVRVSRSSDVTAATNRIVNEQRPPS